MLVLVLCGMKTKKRKTVVSSEPIRMDWLTYDYFKKLIEREMETLQEKFRSACNFIPSLTNAEIRRGEPSGIEKAHRIFIVQYGWLERMKKELFIAAQITYKDHPNPEMRKFWLLEK